MENSREREDKPASWTARVLATVALLVTVLVLFLVINGSLTGSDAGGENATRAQTATTDPCKPSAEQAVEDGFYVLEAGEDLSVVADKTCMDTDELLELNPDLDPLQLQPQNCIDLVPDGCKALAES